MRPTAQWMLWRAIQQLTRGREWLIFPVLILYWLSPIDFLPFNAVDDLLLALGGWLLFRQHAQKKNPPDENGNHRRKDKHIIDIEAEEVK